MKAPPQASIINRKTRPVIVLTLEDSSPAQLTAALIYPWFGSMLSGFIIKYRPKQIPPNKAYNLTTLVMPSNSAP